MNFDLVFLGPPRTVLGRFTDWPAVPRQGESIALTLEGGWEVRLDVADVLYRTHLLRGEATRIEVLVWIPDAKAEEAILKQAKAGDTP